MFSVLRPFCFSPLASYLPFLVGCHLPSRRTMQAILRAHSVHRERNYVLCLRYVCKHAWSREGFILTQSPSPVFLFCESRIS